MRRLPKYILGRDIPRSVRPDVRITLLKRQLPLPVEIRELRTNYIAQRVKLVLCSDHRLVCISKSLPFEAKGLEVREKFLESDAQPVKLSVHTAIKHVLNSQQVLQRTIQEDMEGDSLHRP